MTKTFFILKPPEIVLRPFVTQGQIYSDDYIIIKNARQGNEKQKKCIQLLAFCKKLNAPKID